MDVHMEVDDRAVPWPTRMSFVGQVAATNFACLHLVSQALLDNPNVSCIVETGTYAGAMTMYLGLWGLRLGIPVHTFDIEPLISNDVHHVLDKLDVQCHWVDVFSKQGMRELIACFDGPGYYFVDGGDKQRELQTFAPVLPTGTIFAVHDWGTEVKQMAVGMMWEHKDQASWLAYDARLATVRKIGFADDHYKQTTDEDIKRIADKWIEVIGEETRT